MPAPRSLFALVLVALACASSPKPEATPSTDGKPVTDAPSSPADEKPLTPEEAYARAMPATVLVTTAWGHGTGVFVDESGLLLTNYHVVATGKNEDFGISATVTVPKQNPDGSVSPGERFAAVAWRVDEKRDLALLKVTADRKFPALRISEGDPQPGTRVFALGNAGVGLGWALKRCSINAIGKLDEQVSAIFQVQREDLSAEEKDRIKETLTKAAADAGRQIQTDCSILPGDSGGPLVDESSGRIVGLNVALRTAFSQFVSLGSLAFHIHAAELRDFVKTPPTGPQAFLPDPWVGAGNFGALSDFDQDGEIDSLTFTGSCGENLTCHVAFADADENSFRGKKKVPSASDIQSTRAFDAELAMMKQARMPRKPQAFPVPVSDTLAFIDGDDDGKFERLLVSDGETGGVRGYKLGNDRPERDTALDGVGFSQIASQYANAAIRPAITRFTTALVSGTVELADPAKMRALSGKLADYDKDGQPDAIHIDTRLDKRVLVDADQTGLIEIRDTAAKGKGGRRQHSALVGRLRAGKVHGDVLAVLGAPTRVFYDTDHDGDFDLVLEGASVDSGVALGAATIDASGRLSEAREHVGRRLLRPGLASDKARAKKLAAIFAGAFPAAPRADVEDQVSSFPPALPTAPLGLSRVGDFGNAVVSVVESDSVVILVDLDKPAKGKKKDPLDLVKAGKFDAELTLRFGNGIVWAYYDSDDDKRFDRVFVGNGWSPKRVALAFTLGKGGAQLDKSREGGEMLDPKLFKPAAQQKLLAEIAVKLFP